MNSAHAVQPAYDRQRPPQRDASLSAIVLQADYHITNKRRDSGIPRHRFRLKDLWFAEKFKK